MDGRRQTTQLEISEVSEADSDNPPSALPASKLSMTAGPSAQQRDVVVDRLSRAFADDSITMDEFERRAELVYRATSSADLQNLVADLPAPPEPATESAGKKKAVTRVGEGDTIRTLLGSTERRMPGTMPRYLQVRTMLGNTELDFRHSTFEPGVSEVNVRCLLGNVELTVPDGVRVEILCSSILANVGSTGLFDDHSSENVHGAELRADTTVIPPVSTNAAVVADASAISSNANLPMAEIAHKSPGPTERILRITGRAMFANVEIHKGTFRREP